MKSENHKTYRQFCGIAMALDVVGDRWTLLIVRDLVAGPLRFGDLQVGLMGLAPNLLIDRLKLLIQNGIIEKTATKPGAPPQLYGLTARGLALEPVLHALGAWGMAKPRQPQPADRFRLRWALLAAKRRYQPPALPSSLYLDTGMETYRLDLLPERLEVRDTHGLTEGCVVRGAEVALIHWASGRADGEHLREAGMLHVDGPLEPWLAAYAALPPVQWVVPPGTVGEDAPLA